METLQNILEALNIGVAFIDDRNNIAFMNRLFGEMVHESPEERIGTSVYLCHPAESKPRVEKLIAELRNGSRNHHESWLNFRGRILFEHIYPVRDREGNYVGMVDLLRDAANEAEYLKRLGEWKELPVKGLRKRAWEST